MATMLDFSNVTNPTEELKAFFADLLAVLVIAFALVIILIGASQLLIGGI